MNFLALNLAHDIITGKRSVEDARKAYAEKAMAAMMKQSDPYTEGLQFPAPVGNTGDPDETFTGETVKEEVKDAFK